MNNYDTARAKTRPPARGGRTVSKESDTFDYGDDAKEFPPQGGQRPGGQPPTPPWRRALELKAQLAGQIRNVQDKTNKARARQVFDSEMAKSVQAYRSYVTSRQQPQAATGTGELGILSGFGS